MRPPTFALLLCLACATPAWAQNRPADRVGGAQPPAAEPGKLAEPVGKDAGGFWDWLRPKDAAKSDKVEMPERVERPARIERPDRPERASGGCCQ